MPLISLSFLDFYGFYHKMKSLCNQGILTERVRGEAQYSWHQGGQIRLGKISAFGLLFSGPHFFGGVLGFVVVILRV